MFQDIDRAVSRSSRQQGPSAVDFASEFRAAGFSGGDNRKIDFDVAVARMDIKVRLEVLGQPQCDIAVARAHTPTR